MYPVWFQTDQNSLKGMCIENDKSINQGFLMFPGYIERDLWHEMG